MRILQQFLRKGTETCTDQFDARRIFLLNLFFLVTIATLLTSVAKSIISEEPIEMTIALTVAAVLCVGVPVLGRRNPDHGAIYIMILLNAMVWFFSNSFGLSSGTYIFFFPLFFANGWLMDYRKFWHSAFLLGTTVAGVLLVLIVPDSLLELQITKEIQESSFVFNLATAAMIMAVNTLVIVWLNYRRQQELEQRVEEREKASADLTNALKEKEVLLGEIHHRVKNNLAIVRGLLNMQMNTTTNEIAKTALRESATRVSSMALIHQKLYASDHPNSIDFIDYVNELVQEISYSYSVSETTTPKVNIEVRDVNLTLNRAVPCGLILNEFLTNAFKHAFKNKQTGTIQVSIMHDPVDSGLINMVVADDGIGIPEGFNPKNSSTLGMIIIESLSEQIDGHFTFDSSKNGTRMKVQFPISAKS